MIGKLTLGTGAADLIRYCYYAKDEQGRLTHIIRGELLYSNALYEARLPNGHLDIKALSAQYEEVASTNAKTSKFMWHQTLNFHPDEKISNEMMVRLARDFAQAFGFEDNQYLVFRHRDRANDHFHIIANRINGAGENTASDRKNYERIQQWCRLMEHQYGLRLTENHREKLDARHNRSNRQVDSLRKVLDMLIPECSTLSELSIALRKRNIVMYLGRGVSFTNKSTGVSFKGSDLGREYSRAGIERRLGQALSVADQKHAGRFDGTKREALRRLIDQVVGKVPTPKRGNNASQEAAWRVFEFQLKEKGIELRLERNPDSGKITGVAFQTVLQGGGKRFVNGPELGEQYTHWMLDLRFGKSPKELSHWLRDQDVQGEKEVRLPEQRASGTEGRIIAGPNAAYETNKDLAKIAESQRSVAQKKRRTKL